MGFTLDRINNDKNLLPSLLKIFQCLILNIGEIKKRQDEIKQTEVKVSIKCGNCGKEAMIEVDNINTNYQDIITTFVLNKMFHHVGRL